VFVVTMTQTFMHFLHYRRTEEYIEYLCSPDVEQQRASTAYLSMTETDFFALDSKDGRRNAVCNLLGLVKFWMQEGEDGPTGAEIVEGMEGSHEEVEGSPTFGDADGIDADGGDGDGGDTDIGDADGGDTDGGDVDSDDADADYVDADGDDTDSDDESYISRLRKRKRRSS